MGRFVALLVGSSIALSLMAGPASAASYKEPALTVSAERLAAGFHCPWPVTKKGGAMPVLLVTGTGFTGQEAFLLGSGALHTLAKPVCYVDFPYRTTGDIQTSVQYLVAGIRTLYEQAGRTIAIYGISQGGLLPRWALTYWPSLRKMVSDVIAVAGTQHGSNVIGPCSSSKPCVPAEWQQLAGSNLLKAINREPDESPGSTSWTTIRTLTDETVQPQSGPNPTSSLKGASNILIQSVCPGRTTTHVGSAVDSVSFAAAKDAMSHPGPAVVSRLPANICSSLYAPGINWARISGPVAGLVPDPQTPAPTVTSEPKVQSYALKTVPK